VQFGLAGDLQAAQRIAGQALDVLESRLRTERWLAGPEPTIADIACFPYAALAGEGKVDVSPYPGVQRWIDDLMSLDRFVGMPGIEARRPG
jgi:glutathione S-transferase